MSAYCRFLLRVVSISILWCVVECSANNADLYYSSYLGGSTSDYAEAVCTYAHTNIVIVGQTRSLNFPTKNAYQNTHAGGEYDLFIARFDQTGSNMAYSTYLGGSGDEWASDVYVYPDGRVLVVGDTTSADFPTSNAYQSAYGGNGDTFVTEISADGSSLLFSTFLGGSAGDWASHVQPFTNDDICVIGTTESSDFPTSNAWQSAAGGYKDVFLSTLSPCGSTMMNSTYYGGDGDDTAYDAVLTTTGCAIVGMNLGGNLPLSNAFQVTYNGNGDAFVASFGLPFPTLQSASYYGGSGYDIGRTIAVDPQQRLVFAGYTASTDLYVKSAFQNNAAGSYDAFVVALSSTTGIRSATYLGGEANEFVRGSAFDPLGRYYLAGNTVSTGFPIRLAYQSTHAGTTANSDVFVTRFDNTLNTISYSTFMGGSNSDYAASMTLDNEGNPWVCGYTYSQDLPVTPNAFAPTFQGAPDDAFYTKILSPPEIWNSQIVLTPTGVTVSWEGDLSAATQSVKTTTSLLPGTTWTQIHQSAPVGGVYSQQWHHSTWEIHQTFYRVDLE